jgi:hypothetical protein
MREFHLIQRRNIWDLPNLLGSLLKISALGLARLNQRRECLLLGAKGVGVDVNRSIHSLGDERAANEHRGKRMISSSPAGCKVSQMSRLNIKPPNHIRVIMVHWLDDGLVEMFAHSLGIEADILPAT